MSLTTDAVGGGVYVKMFFNGKHCKLRCPGIDQEGSKDCLATQIFVNPQILVVGSAESPMDLEKSLRIHNQRLSRKIRAC